MFDTLAPASYPAALRRAEPLARRPRKYDVQHLEDIFPPRSDRLDLAFYTRMSFLQNL